MRTSTLFSVGEIRHLDPGLKGKRAMRGGELLHVVNLAGSRAASVIGDAVPTGDAGLASSDARAARAATFTRADMMTATRDDSAVRVRRTRNPHESAFGTLINFAST